jgi:hypothetical protein
MRRAHLWHCFSSKFVTAIHQPEVTIKMSGSAKKLTVKSLPYWEYQHKTRIKDFLDNLINTIGVRQ